MDTYRFEFTKQALFINESLNRLATAQGRWYEEYLACFKQEERWLETNAYHWVCRQAK